MEFKKRRYPGNGIFPFAMTCILLIAACKNAYDPGISPAGSYEATSLVTTTNGQNTAHLESTISIVLTPQGTTSGHMHIVPAGGLAPVDADLTGTWRQIGSAATGSGVDLDHAADTFLRDMPLTFSGTILRGDRTFGPTRIQLILTRTAD